MTKFTSFLIVLSIFFSVICFPSPIATSNMSGPIKENISAISTTNKQTIPDTFRIIDTFPIYGFDPHVNFNRPIISLAYDSLIDIDPLTNKIVPSLAKQWVVTNDSTLWTFTLRSNVFFHDGSRLTSLSVKFSLERFFSSDYSSLNGASYMELLQFNFKSITIIDNYTFSILLFSPDSLTLTFLSYIKIISPNSLTNGVFVNPIGTGPYSIDTTNSSFNSITFIRNNQYFKGIPLFKTIFYETFYGKINQIQRLSDSGSADLIIGNNIASLRSYFINETNFNDASAWTRHLIDKVAGHEIGIFNFNVSLFSNVKVRQALNFAIDRSKYVDQLHPGMGIPKTSLFTHNYLYFDDQIQGYPFNLQKAQSLLDESGYIVQKNGFRFNLTVSTLVNKPERGVFTCEAFKLLDINCSVRSQSLSQLFSGNFEFFVVGNLHIPSAILPYDFLQSTSQLNLGGFSNAKIDTLLQKAMETPVVQEQKFYFQEIQQLSQDLSPYVLFSDFYYPYAVKKNYNSLILFNSNNFLCFPAYYASHQYDVVSVSNVHVKDKSIYAQTINLGIQNIVAQELIFNIDKTANSSNFSPLPRELGIFYRINVNEQIPNYTLKIYLEPEMVLDDTLQLYYYNTTTESWDSLKFNKIDKNFNFIEINCQGDVMLRLVNTLTTYILFPIAIGLSGFMIVLSIVTINKNRKKSNHIRKLLYEKRT